MSSERAGTPDEDAEWADYAAWIDRANTPSERAGVHTSCALNREQARQVLTTRFGSPYAADDDLLDALETCVVPDLRITRIAELSVYRRGPDSLGWISADAVDAILRGAQ